MTADEMKQIKDLIDDRAARTERHFDEKTAETQRHFDIVAEALTADIRLVAAGHVTLNEKLDRLQEEMCSGFDEIRSAIRFSYAELDRRVSTLESEFVSFATRLERVEALVAN